MAVLIGLAAVLVGCDPTWATVVQNEGGEIVTVRVSTDTGGTTPSDADFEVAPGKRIQVGSAGVASQGTVVSASILDPSCRVMARVPIAGFDEGGVVHVGLGALMTVVAGGNPTGDVGTTTARCSAY